MTSKTNNFEKLLVLNTDLADKSVKDLQKHCSKTSSIELAEDEQYDEACKTFSFDCRRW